MALFETTKHRTVANALSVPRPLVLSPKNNSGLIETGRRGYVATAIVYDFLGDRVSALIHAMVCRSPRRNWYHTVFIEDLVLAVEHQSTPHPTPTECWHDAIACNTAVPVALLKVSRSIGARSYICLKRLVQSITLVVYSSEELRFM